MVIALFFLSLIVSSDCLDIYNVKPNDSLSKISKSHGVYDEGEIKFKGWVTDRLGFSGNMIYSNSYNDWGVYSFGDANLKLIYKFN